MKKISIFLIVAMFMAIFSENYIYASFADYTDEDAEKETQNMIQEHNENFDSSKSENNYLKDLNITGGKISPEFDRQNLEYTFKIENKTKQINITANPEDKRATVNGTGTIEITDVSECRIDVIAENGTTRTYLIKIVKENEDKIEETSNKEPEDNELILSNDNIQNQTTNQAESEKKIENSNSQSMIKSKGIIIAIIIIAIFIIGFIIIKIIRKK